MLILLLLVAVAVGANTTPAVFRTLITTHGEDLARTPLCATVGALDDCVVAGSIVVPEAQKCTALANCTHVWLNDTGDKNANIRMQEALVADADWFLILKPSFRMAEGWAAEVAALTEAWPDACIVGACIDFHGHVDHVNHKALYRGACYRAAVADDRPPRESWARNVDMSLSRTMRRRGDAMVCDPRFNGHLHPADDDIFFRTDAPHKYRRIVGVVGVDRK